MDVFRFLKPKILYETSSGFNHEIKVIKVGNSKKLIVDGFVQSLDESSKFAQKRVWGKVAKIIKRRNPSTKNVLLLGMGAGTMVHMINKYLNTNKPKITSVEIDEQIVFIAKKFFSINSIENNRIIIADAYDLVTNPKKYKVTQGSDCIIVDTYCGENYPENISSEMFLTSILKILNKNGFVVFNKVILRNESNKVNKYKDLYSEYLDSIEVTKIDCKGISDNFLYHGFKKTTSIPPKN